MPCARAERRERPTSAALGASSTRSTSALALSADGGFDLRQPLLDARARDQLRERPEQLIERRHQNGATRHVRDVRRRALAKTDEHALLARHVFHAEPRAAAIAPRPARERRQPLPGSTRAMRVNACATTSCLNRSWRVVREVLQHAAAAAAEILAPRRRRARATARRRARAPPRRSLRRRLRSANLDGLAGQRVRHEHAAAVDVRDTLAVVGEVEDLAASGAPSARMSRRAPGREKPRRCGRSDCSSIASTCCDLVGVLLRRRARRASAGSADRSDRC